MKLTAQELQTLQDMNAEFARKKMLIGELELQKKNVLSEISTLQHQFSLEEKKLIEKYGEDAIINLQTGEVTQKLPKEE